MSTGNALTRSATQSVTACCLVLLASLTLPAGAKADDWPSFGIDARHAGASAERSGPAFRGGSWKYSATSSLWNTSSPAIADGIVVFGLRDGTVQAMRASTGRQLWQLKTTDSIVASPAIRQGRVFVSSLDGKLYALRLADGAVVWTKTLGGLEQASPTIVGDSLIVAGGSPARKVFRIDTATGQTIWETSPSVMVQFSNSAAVSDGDQVIVGAMQGHLYSFDFATGALRWTYEADGIVNLSAPVIVGGRVYLLPGGDSQSLHAVDLASGNAIPGWPVQLPSPSPDGGLAGTRINRSLAVSSLTSVDGGLLFDVRFDDAFDTDKDNIADQWLAQEFVMAASADDGHILWQQGNGRAVLQSPNDLPKNWLCPTPAAYQSTIRGSSYLAVGSSLLGTVKTLDAASGVTRGSITIDAPSRVSPAVANGRIFVGTESGVFQSNLSSTNQPPDVPTLKGASGRAVGANNALVEWGTALDPEGDSVSYQVRVDHDAEILESWEAEVTTGPGVTSVRLPRPLQAGLTYAAAVRARDANGAWSSWSALQFFQVVETPQISVDGAPLAAADLASALAGAAIGSVVHLDPGTFHLSETMRIPAGVSLEGAGAGQTILDATGQAIGISLDGSVDGTPTEIRNLTVAGAKVGIAVGATHGARMRNVIVRDNWDAGVDVSAAGTAEISQATLAANGCAVRSFGTITVKNSIVVGNQIGFQADHAGALASQYNDLTGNPVALRGMSNGPHDLSSDVTFMSYPKRDLHVARGQASTDQGDPADDASQEPAPNGGRVNLGAFGGTPEAELSATPPSAGATVPGAASKGSSGCSVGAATSDGAGFGWGSLAWFAWLALTAAALFRRRHSPSTRRMALLLGAFLLICSTTGTAGAATCAWNQGSAQSASVAGLDSDASVSNGRATLDLALLLAAAVLVLHRWRRLAVVVVLLSSLAPQTSSAITCTWKASGGSGGNNWSQSDKWTKTGSGGNAACPAGTNDAAVFDTGSVACAIDANISVASFALNSGYSGVVTQNSTKTLTTSGTFTMGNGTTGDFVGGDSAMTIGTDLSILAGSGSAFTSTTGTLTVGGDLTINDGLVGYWKLDENTGSTITDSSGFGNDGTLFNSSWVSGASLPTLNYDNTSGVSFNGTTAYATLGISNLPAINGSMTIAFWMYYASIPASQQNAVVLKSATPGNIQVGFLSNKISAFKSGGNLLVAATSTPTSGWHHVAYTYNGSNLNSLYVDGGTAATSATATDSGTPTTAWLGNYTSSGGSPLAGRLDDVRIYNRVLSATEVASLAAGDQPNTSVATRTLAGSSVINGDLVIGSGALAGGNTAMQVKGNWWNYGGVFTTGTTGGVTFNGTASGKTIRASRSDFNGVTINGSGGAWTMSDTGGVVLEKDLTISAGTLTAPPSTTLEIRGAFNKTAGTFTPNSGTVLLSSGTSQSSTINNATFNNLTINDGLVGYWRLDEASGTTAPDSSGFGNDGTYTGSPTHASSSPPTNFSDPYDVTLNGTSQCVQLGNPTAMNITGPITMAAWVNSPASYSASFNDILAHGYIQSPTNAGVYLRVSVASAIASYDCGTFIANGTDSHTTYTVPAGDINAWVHLACTYDGTAWNLYRNGVLVSSTSGVAPVSVAATWAIGSKGTCNGRYFSGSIDDVRLYNRALSATEISGLGIGNQPGTASATYTMTGSATIAGDLVIASGKLAAGTSSISLGGNWLNYGGLFTAGSTGLVTLDGTASGKVIQSAGQTFGNVTVNGTGGAWTLNDRLEVNPASTLTMTSGTLSLSSYTFRGGNVDNNGVALTTSTGKVVLDGSASPSANTDQGAFTDLRIEPVSATNLVGYWKLDGGQGPTARDFSGNGNDGTLTSGPQWVDSGLPSAISFDDPAALTFNGASSQYVTTASPLPAVLQPAVVTMAGWYKAITVDPSGPGGEIVSGSDRYSLRVVSNTSVMVIKRTATSTWITLAGTVSNALDGSWHHVAGVISSSGMTLYFDGVSVASNADTTAIDYNASGLVGLNIGRDPISASYDFTGTIDDVRIYNVALTAAQIKALAAGRYPAGLSGAPTYTLGATTTVSGNFGLDSGTLATSSYTFGATSASATAAYVNSGTYSVGSAASTFSGGLTVRSQGTLDLSTSGGAVKIGSAKVLTVDGTLSASSTGATIQSSAGTYSFQVGSTSTATPTLNISGLAVKNTDSNGMYVNAVSGSATTFTQFDNIAFSAGSFVTGTTGGRLLQIYASSLNLVSNGCSFDSGVAAASKTTAYNVTLRGDGSATETRAEFGNATCFSGNSPTYALCEAYDDDDDANNDGIGDNAGSNGAVVQWIHSGKVDTNGTIEGFPTTAFDWNTFTYYSTYVVYHDVDGGTADRLYVRDTNGNAKAGYATPYWTSPTGEDVVGTPRFDTVSSVHYVYLATSAGHVYRLIDNTGAGTLTNDSTGNWAGANNPYDCSCTITTPLALDTNNLYWGGTASGNKVWTLGKTSRALASSSPATVTNVISGATPALWTSGDTYIFMGSAATFYKVDVTTQTTTTNNASPTGTVNGRISIINNKVYGADNAGSLWVLNPVDITTPLWSYHDNTNHSGCTSGQTCAITSSLYVDPTVNRAFYGDSDGHLYASYNSTGTTGAQWTTGYPFRASSSTTEVYATAPLYLSGILVAGTTTGSLYLIDVNGGSGPVLKQTYQFGSSTKVSGIAYDRGSSSYMISTSNASVKDGKLIYIDAIPDPTPTFN